MEVEAFEGYTIYEEGAMQWAVVVLPEWLPLPPMIWEAKWKSLQPRFSKGGLEEEFNPGLGPT